MEELKGMFTNPVLTLVGILLVLREIHALVGVIKTLITQRNDAFEASSKTALSLLTDIRTGIARLYQLIRSR